MEIKDNGVIDFGSMAELDALVKGKGWQVTTEDEDEAMEWLSAEATKFEEGK